MLSRIVSVKMTAPVMRPVGVNSFSFARTTRSMPTSVLGDPVAGGGRLTKNAIISAIIANVAVAKTTPTPSKIFFTIPKSNPKFPFD